MAALQAWQSITKDDIMTVRYLHPNSDINSDLKIYFLFSIWGLRIIKKCNILYTVHLM